MFVKAIKENVECVKIFSSAYKTAQSDDLVGIMGTIILINDEGWVLTCKHVAENIIHADKITASYEAVKKELLENKIPPKKIFKKYNIKESEPLIFKNVFLNVLESWSEIKLIMHEQLDLALIKFENPGKIFCDKYPIFSKTVPEIGESVCRLGYPYSEQLTFKYDYRAKDIFIKENLDANFPVYPLDGMVTRYLLDQESVLSMFEITNPTLRGQDGGPIINKDGQIVGMAIASALKDLEMDVDTKLKRGIKEIDAKQSNFMHFGIGINVETLKEFLKANKVKFNEQK